MRNALGNVKLMISCVLVGKVAGVDFDCHKTV